MILAVVNAIYAIAYIKKPLKSQDLKGVWTCDRATMVRCSNQVGYEATDFRSWSFVGPKEPGMNEFWSYIWNTSYIELLMNVIYAIEYKEAWNSQEVNRVWTLDLVYLCDTLANWAMKPRTLGAGDKSYININQSVENEQYVSPTIQDLYTALLGSKVCLWCEWYILFKNLINFIVNGRK